MRYRYTEEEKLAAKRMFIEGYSLKDIADNIAESTGKKANASLIQQWADDGDWYSEKRKIISQAENKLSEDIQNDLVERMEQHRDAYRQMVDKGLEALKTTPVENMNEVIGLIDKGIRGERQISFSLVSQKYVEYVVQVICEEVQDEDAKRRIARKLNRLTSEVMSL